MDLEHPEITWAQRTGYPSWAQEGYWEEEEEDGGEIGDVEIKTFLRGLGGRGTKPSPRGEGGSPNGLTDEGRTWRFSQWGR